MRSEPGWEGLLDKNTHKTRKDTFYRCRKLVHEVSWEAWGGWVGGTQPGVGRPRWVETEETWPEQEGGPPPTFTLRTCWVTRRRREGLPVLEVLLHLHELSAARLLLL